MSEALTSEILQRVRDTDWFLDSGATDHMFNRRDCYTTYEAFDSPTSVRIGDGRFIEAYGKGSINVCHHVRRTELE